MGGCRMIKDCGLIGCVLRAEAAQSTGTVQDTGHSCSQNSRVVCRSDREDKAWSWNSGRFDNTEPSPEGWPAKLEQWHLLVLKGLLSLPKPTTSYSPSNLNPVTIQFYNSEYYFYGYTIQQFYNKQSNHKPV